VALICPICSLKADEVRLSSISYKRQASDTVIIDEVKNYVFRLYKAHIAINVGSPSISSR
jgi:hypothetical protein